MKLVYRVVKFKLRLMLTLSLCLLAVYVAGGRYLTYKLNDFEQDLESILSANIGKQVRIDSLQGAWSGFDPEIQINGFKVAHEVASIEQVTLRFAFWDSLQARQLRFKFIEVLKPQLHIKQRENGWRIAGFELEHDFDEDSLTRDSQAPATSAANEHDFRQWFDGANISLVESHIIADSMRNKRRDWRLPSISVSYHDNQVFASGLLVHHSELQPVASFSIHGEGVLSDAPVSGELFVEARSLHFLDELLEGYRFKGIGINSLDASGRVWANFEDFKLTDLQGDIQVSELGWVVKDKPQQPIKNVATRFAWSPTEQGSEFAFNDLAWSWQGQQCMPSSGKLSSHTDAEGWLKQGQLYIDKIYLDCVNRLVLGSDIPEGHLYERLDTSRPQGMLEDFLLQWQSPVAKAEASVAVISNASASTNVSVSTKAAEQGASQASASVELVESQGLATEIAAPANADPDPQADSPGSTTPKSAPQVAALGEGATPAPTASALPPAPEPVAANFSLDARLRDVALKAYGGTPSAKGLNGYLYADKDGGTVWLDSEGFELGFPNLYLEPWQVTRAQGLVSWQLADDSVRVKSEGLHLHINDGSLVYGDFLLRLNPAEDEDYLALALALQDVPFEKVTTLVPYHIVGDSLHSWLDGALRSGTATSGVYYGYGSIEEDSAANSFTSSLRVNTRQGELLFEDSWPALKQLNAEIMLQDDQLWIEAPTAKIQQTTLNKVRAYLPASQAGNSSVLQVSALARLDEPQVSYWLEDSPLKAHTKQIAEMFDLEGLVDVDLGLSIPMDGADVGYNINAGFSGNRVAHGLSGLSFDEVHGLINVNSDSLVSCSALSLELFGRPFALDIESQPNPLYGALLRQGETLQQGRKPDVPQFTGTKLSFTGSSSIQSVLAHFDLWPVFGLAGDMKVAGELNIPFEAGGVASLYLNSDLHGIARNWPAPLLKTADQTEDLQLRLDFMEHETKLQASLSKFGPQGAQRHALYANLGIPHQGELYGLVGLNNKPALVDARSDEPTGKRGGPGTGLSIYAAEVSAQLEPWLDFVEDFSQVPPGSKELELTGSGALGTEPPVVQVVDAQNLDAQKAEVEPAQPLLRYIHADLEAASALGQDFGALALELGHHKSGWHASIKGAQIEGQVSLPTDKRVLGLDFKRLALRAPSAELANKASSAEASGQQNSQAQLAQSDAHNNAERLDPRDVPELSFRSDSLILDGQDYGAWSAQVKKHDNGVLIWPMKGYLAGIDIDASLNWTIRDDQPRSFLEFDFKGGDIESVFKHLAKTAPIDSDTTRGQASLVWPDHPHEFSLDSLSGSLSLAMKDGFLKTPDEKTGALRLLAIFNAEALGRRLSLDFSDLYKSGIGYDDFELNAVIDSGRLQFKPALKISGPSSSYEVKGSTDLAKQTLDLDMEVTLPVTSNVPLAALMLGAPQVGGALWLLDKVLGEPLSSITSIDYRVKGTWDDPKVEN